MLRVVFSVFLLCLTPSMGQNNFKLSESEVDSIETQSLLNAESLVSFSLEDYTDNLINWMDLILEDYPPDNLSISVKIKRSTVSRFTRQVEKFRKDHLRPLPYYIYRKNLAGGDKYQHDLTWKVEDALGEDASIFRASEKWDGVSKKFEINAYCDSIDRYDYSSKIEFDRKDVIQIPKTFGEMSEAFFPDFSSYYSSINNSISSDTLDHTTVFQYIFDFDVVLEGNPTKAIVEFSYESYEQLKNQSKPSKVELNFRTKRENIIGEWDEAKKNVKDLAQFMLGTEWADNSSCSAFNVGQINEKTYRKSKIENIGKALVVLMIFIVTFSIGFCLGIGHLRRKMDDICGISKMYEDKLHLPATKI